MAVSPEKMGVTAKNAGAVWCAMAAYDLQGDPRYAELERKLGVNAAKSIAITSAGNFWNADIAFSSDRLRDTDVSLDDSRATGARLSVFNAVHAIASDRGLGPDAIGRIADSFYSKLSNFQRASLGTNPGSIPGQADLSAEIVKEVNQATAKTDTATFLLDAGAKALAAGLSAMRMNDMAESSRNGSRYDQLGSASASTSGTSYYSTPAGINEMRSFAVENGIAWATGAPDLLRLGKPALLEVAKAHISKQDFAELKKDVGYTAKDVVTVAKFANKFHQDGHKLSQDIVTTANTMEPDDTAKRHAFGRQIVGIIDAATQNPQDPKIQKMKQDVIDHYKNDPHKQSVVKRFLHDTVDAAIKQDQTATQDKKASVSEDKVITDATLKSRDSVSEKQVKATVSADTKAKADQAADDEFAATPAEKDPKKSDTAQIAVKVQPTETAKADDADKKVKDSDKKADAKQTAIAAQTTKNRIASPSVG